ncbi:MAG: ABC transporter ATP-binding protein [Opitutales bacterium]
METTPSIHVENLTRLYGSVPAIRNINFSVYPGEIVGFLGPNGAGKSTTMRILCGIQTATSGAAWVNGISVAENPREVKRKLGYMPENNPLPVDMRVVEYLRFRARLKGVPSLKINSAVREVMEICDLSRTARRKIIGTLSKGFRQRVGVADALLGKPEVIIMDEPTIGLDPHQVQGIRRLIDNLRGRLTVVISSHILPEIERSCDRMIIINLGRVVATGTSHGLREEFLPGERFDIEFEGSPEEVVRCLREASIEVDVLETSSFSEKIHQQTLRAEGNGELGPRLIQRLSESPGLTLRSLNRHSPNLEEIFLAATRRSWEESADVTRVARREANTTKTQN